MYVQACPATHTLETWSVVWALVVNVLRPCGKSAMPRRWPGMTQLLTAQAPGRMGARGGRGIIGCVRVCVRVRACVCPYSRLCEHIPCVCLHMCTSVRVRAGVCERACARALITPARRFARVVFQDVSMPTPPSMWACTRWSIVLAPTPPPAPTHLQGSPGSWPLQGRCAHTRAQQHLMAQSTCCAPWWGPARPSAAVPASQACGVGGGARRREAQARVLRPRCCV